MLAPTTPDNYADARHSPTSGDAATPRPVVQENVPQPSKEESATVVSRLPEQGTPTLPSKEENAAAESRISEQEMSRMHPSKEASAPSKEGYAIATDPEVSEHPSKEASAPSKETHATTTDQKLLQHTSKEISAETKLQLSECVPSADKGRVANPSNP